MKVENFKKNVITTETTLITTGTNVTAKANEDRITSDKMRFKNSRKNRKNRTRLKNVSSDGIVFEKEIV